MRIINTKKSKNIPVEYFVISGAVLAYLGVSLVIAALIDAVAR